MAGPVHPRSTCTAYLQKKCLKNDLVDRLLVHSEQQHVLLHSLHPHIDCGVNPLVDVYYASVSFVPITASYYLFLVKIRAISPDLSHFRRHFDLIFHCFALKMLQFVTVLKEKLAEVVDDITPGGEM